MEYLREIEEFVIGLCHNWVALFSGIASAVLTVYGATFPLRPLNHLVFVSAGVCAVVASYLMWLREFRLRTKPTWLDIERRKIVQTAIDSLGEEARRILSDIATKGSVRSLKAIDEEDTSHPWNQLRNGQLIRGDDNSRSVLSPDYASDIRAILVENETKFRSTSGPQRGS